MATDVTVCLPWRPQPDRMHAYNRVRAFWDTIGYPIIQANSQPNMPWHLAEARNHAVQQCDGIVIVADADTIIDPANIEAAIALAEGDCVVWPYTRYHYLPAHAVDVACLAEVEPIYTKPGHNASDRPSVGGIFVTNTETYWRIGGQDERLERRWGFEDDCFLAAAETLSTVYRLDGDIYAFAHAVVGGRDWSDANPNFHRHELYKLATGRPELMRELVKR